MHILIGMLVATIALIGWARGSLFFCVFLSIVPGTALFVFLLQDSAHSPNHGFWSLMAGCMLVVVWLPRRIMLWQINRHLYRPRADWLPPVKQDISFVRAAGTGVLIIGAVTLLMMPVFLLGRP